MLTSGAVSLAMKNEFALTLVLVSYKSILSLLTRTTCNPEPYKFIWTLTSNWAAEDLMNLSLRASGRENVHDKGSGKQFISHTSFFLQVCCWQRDQHKHETYAAVITGEVFFCRWPTESCHSDFGLDLYSAKVVLSFTHIGGLIFNPEV